MEYKNIMNAEIRKDMKIKEEELEQVSGGYWGEEYAPNCPNCNTKIRSHFIRVLPAVTESR